MIKEVLGVILATSFSLRGTPLRAQTQYIGISGYWNLKDELGHMDNASLTIGSYDRPFDYYVYSIDENMFIKMNNMVISQQQVNDVWNYAFSCIDYNENFEIIDQYTCEVSGQYLDNSSEKCQNFLIYIPYTYGFDYTSGNYSRFTEFMTQQNNQYITSYNGWYYMANSPANNNDNLNFELIGGMTITNKLVTGITNYKPSGGFYYTMTAGMPAYLVPESMNNIEPVNFTIWDGKWEIKDRNMYFNIPKLIPKVKSQLESLGTFGYVPQVTPGEYSFSDLFFDLADTPIYFIYSMFNWELFGANLFLAFTGLMSIGLVLVLFRKFM